MKIAHIVCVYPPYKSGTGQVAYEFVHGLKRLGNQVDVFTPKYKTKEKPEDNAFYLRPFLYIGNGAILPQLLWRLRKYDIIHIHYPFFGSVEILAIYSLIKSGNQKLFIHYHMDVNFKNKFIKLLSLPEALFRSILFAKAKNITISSFDYAEHSKLSKLLMKYKSKLIELPFGVDSKTIVPKVKKESDKVRFLFVSNLDKAHYFKGLDKLLQVISKINFSIELRVVGDGDMLDDYKILCKKFNIEEKLKFLGGLSDEERNHEYSQADAFILPSINRNEAFGLVLLEAMSAGTPVIASNLPGVRTVFDDGEQGFYFKTGDYDDLKNKMEIITKDKELRKTMGEKARTLVEKKYSWEKISSQLEDIYIRK
jgi:glycosyltransferase involved in cell wall biosynthesis